MILGDISPSSVGTELGMHVRVLGCVDVIDGDGSHVSLGGPAQVKLLSLLVASAPRPIAVDDIIVEIWAGADLPADPVAAIRTYVARLRQAIGSAAIVTAPGSYSLGAVRTDAADFETFVDTARAAGVPQDAARLWQIALDLWRGSAFGDLGDSELIGPRAQRLEELRAEAIEAWIESRLATGEGRELVADVQAAVEQHPLREALRAQQLTVLARAGRQADALRAFQSFRRDLADIGLEPSPGLVDLDAAIATGDVPATAPRARTHRRHGRCPSRRSIGSKGACLPRSCCR